MRQRAVLVFLALAGLTACRRAPEPGPAPAAPALLPVVVATAQKIDAPVFLRTIGSVEPKARVMLRPQVTAKVKELAAPEGTDVNAGQAVILLDAGPFETTLRQAEAELDHARAVAEDAHRLVDRLKEATTAVSQREVEEAAAKAKAADADTASKEAMVGTARWNVSYCTITAPFTGRLGAYLVKPGAIVKSEEADLVELTQVDPIEVGFSVPEENIPAIREAMGRGRVEVDALPAGEAANPVKGTLTFFDNKVDPMTGTIRLKATFANADRRLWPGRFANVSVLLALEPDSVGVPEAAVVTSQSGPSVFVVKKDQSVEIRPVRVRRTVDGTSIIDSGVSAGETVVTEGQLRLGPNSKVQPKGPPSSPAQGTPAAAMKTP
jgi:multidrug efflux system membrane fusion protein